MILGVKSETPTFINKDFNHSITSQSGMAGSNYGYISFTITLYIFPNYTVLMLVNNITLNP